ncbi:MAG TPA: 30S ribosomal protein S20 [Elusimicrobia bacterium]|nr:MAG: 30S ribosomal protein S20 [Elusimicrobia bacterium GWD2_63_28]HCC47107.1 30S ribosomal protein S20 [Elusimicrobiota bacterium]
MAKLKTGRHTSAIKAWRKSEKLASKHRGVKTRIHDTAKEFGALVEKKDLENAQKMLPKAYSLLDKAAKTGTLHWKTAARRKSRLAARIKTVAKNPSVK